MSNLIKDYEDEFTAEAETVRREMQSLRAGFPASVTGAADTPSPSAAAAKPVSVDRPAANRTLATRLKRMKDVLANLAVEIAQAPADVRTEAQGRLAGYKASMGALEKEAATVKKLSADSDRDDLLRNATTTAAKNMSALSGDADGDTTRMKQQLARNTQKMKDSSKTLQDAERLTTDMNAIADDTLMALEDQRHKIRRIGETVRDTDEELSQVQRILRKMHKEMLKNKLMLSGVIVMLLIMIIGLLYYKFGGTSATHEGAAEGVSGGGGGGSVPTEPPGTSDWMPTLDPVTPPPPVIARRRGQPLG
jgi:vesicle transport through interaction with t-SNAREs protein 1